MAKARFAFHNLYDFKEKFFDWVFLYDGSSYTDYTDNARNITDTFTATGTSTNHALYFGMKDAEFYHIRILLDTIAAGGTRTWELK